MLHLASHGSSSGELSSGDIAKCAAVASFLTKTAVHPVDTIKCRLQSRPYPGNLRLFAREWEGQWTVRSLYRGLAVKMVAYAPQQSIYVTTYSVAKRRLDDVPPFTGATAVICATACGSAASSVLRVPIEVVKMRLQSCQYSDLRHAARRLRADGAWHLARMAVPQIIVHDLPYGAVQWLAYEYVQPRLRPSAEWAVRRWRGPRDGSATASAAASGLVSGTIAGCVAGAVTTPLDVVKTATIVTAATDRRATVSSVASSIYRKEGARGFLRGTTARIVWISSNVGLYLAFFESLKARYALRVPNDGHGRS